MSTEAFLYLVQLEERTNFEKICRPHRNYDGTEASAQSESPTNPVKIRRKYVPQTPSRLFMDRSGSRQPRTLPNYLKPKTAKNNQLSNYVVDEWDARNQEVVLDLEKRFLESNDLQGLYEVLQSKREAERKEMESRGLVDAENTRKKLEDAITFRGSCRDMCPTFERVRRAYENNVKEFEKDPETGRVSRDYAVKTFSRPAAGQPPPLPSDVRPPDVLVSTLMHLINNILPKLPASHSFLWDRTRSIRQDFTYQNYTGPEAVICNEVIVRIHIVTLHVMANSGLEYSPQQELEQMNKSLQTLMDFYHSMPNYSSAFEAEMRAYVMLSHLRDPEVEHVVQRQMPYCLWSSRHVIIASWIKSLCQQNNISDRGHVNTENASNLFTQLFAMLRDSGGMPFLQLCLLETHFVSIRLSALKAMSSAYHQRGKPYPISRLTKMLEFDSVDQTVAFCRHYSMIVTHEDDVGELCVDFSSLKTERIESATPLPPTYTLWLEDKRNGISDIDYVGAETVDLPNNPVRDMLAEEILKGLLAETVTGLLVPHIGQLVNEAKLESDRKKEFEERRKELERQQREEEEKRQEAAKKELERQKQEELNREKERMEREKQEEMKREKERLLREKQEEVQREKERMEREKQEEVQREIQRQRELEKQERERQEALEREQELQRQIEMGARKEALSKALCTELYNKFYHEMMLELYGDLWRNRVLVRHIITALRYSCNVLKEHRKEEEEALDLHNTLMKEEHWPILSYIRQQKRRRSNSEAIKDYMRLQKQQKLRLGRQDQKEQLLEEQKSNRRKREEVFLNFAFADLEEKRQGFWKPLNMKRLLTILNTNLETVHTSVSIYSPAEDEQGYEESAWRWMKVRLGLKEDDNNDDYDEKLFKDNEYKDSWLKVTRVSSEIASYKFAGLFIYIVPARWNLLHCIRKLTMFIEKMLEECMYVYDVLLVSWGIDANVLENALRVLTRLYNPRVVGRFMSLVFERRPDVSKDNLEDLMVGWACEFKQEKSELAFVKEKEECQEKLFQLQRDKEEAIAEELQETRLRNEEQRRRFASTGFYRLYVEQMAQVRLQLQVESTQLNNMSNGSLGESPSTFNDQQNDHHSGSYNGGGEDVTAEVPDPDRTTERLLNALQRAQRLLQQ